MHSESLIVNAGRATGSQTSARFQSGTEVDASGGRSQGSGVAIGVDENLAQVEAALVQEAGDLTGNRKKSKNDST